MEKRLLSEFGYGLDKILIAFGILSTSFIDHLFGLFSILSLLAGIVLLRWREVRAWGFTILIAIFLLAVQAGMFQAVRRFVVSVLFPFSIVCLGLILGKLSFALTKKRSLWRTN